MMSVKRNKDVKKANIKAFFKNKLTRLSNLKEDKIIFIMIFSYILLFSIIVCLNHVTFQTQTYDLGIFEQTFWNTIHGDFFYNTIENTSHFGVHMSPILVLLVPFYYLFPSPYFLLIFQTIALGVGAFPLYLLAKKYTKQNIAIMFAGLYLIYPSLHYINLFDFHAVALAIPLLLFALYFIEDNNYTYASVFLFLSAMCKENIIIAVAFVGIYVFFVKKNRKFGLIVFLLSLIWFIVSVGIIMPSLGEGLLRLDIYPNLGTNPLSIIKNIFNPFIVFPLIFSFQKLSYLFKIFFPVCFLPLLAFPELMLLIPGLAQNLLTTQSNQFSTHYQYDAILIPFMFFSMVIAFRKLLYKRKELVRILLILIVVVSVFSFFIFSPVSPLNFTKKFNVVQDVDALYEIKGTIPENASVTSTTYLLPHLAHRKHIYMIGHEKQKTDYVVVDTRVAFPFQSIESKVNYLSKYENYSYDYFSGRYVVFKKD